MIVVGVDGSEEAKRALGWALSEAQMRHTPLRVVYAWRLPIVDYWSYAPADFLDPDGFAERARALIDQSLEEVGGADCPVEIERLTYEGPPVKTLIDAAKGAEMLVVGSRGRGEFTGLLLGSVSMHCAQHATCPVVIVRAKEDEKNGDV